MATKINFNQVRSEVASSYEETLKKEGLIFAQEILQENLDKYINEIKNHPVSKELDGGPDSENISDTLNGKENLFAFIGFDNEDKPIDDLTELIRQNTSLDKRSTFDKKSFQLKIVSFTKNLVILFKFIIFF